MEIKELQNQAEEIVTKIDNKINFAHNDENTLMHLTEELGEIARAILNPKMKRENMNIDNLKEEIADVVLLVLKLANNHNIDLEEAINNKMKKLKRRHNLE